MENLTPVPGATPRYDDDGREIVDVVTCGTCGRSWNDAAISSLTPTPSARCPFEYEHTEVESIYMVERADGSGYRRVSRDVTLARVYELEGADGDEEANTVTYWYRRAEEI
jgi:hypothetical protein